MADIVLTEEEAERLSAMPKRTEGKLMWQFYADAGVYEFELSVECAEQLPLTFWGQHNPRTGYYKFVLAFAKSHVRRLDVGKGHHNPACDRIGWPHKHKWTDREKGHWAYEPPEMSANDSPAELYAKFVAECNIAPASQFVYPPQSEQRELGI